LVRKEEKERKKKKEGEENVESGPALREPVNGYVYPGSKIMRRKGRRGNERRVRIPAKFP